MRQGYRNSDSYGGGGIGGRRRQYRENRGTNIWDNGSTICDQWLRWKVCKRENCQWNHRMPRPGEPLPLCPRAMRMGVESCIPDCPCSHDLPIDKPLDSQERIRNTLIRPRSRDGAELHKVVEQPRTRNKEEAAQPPSKIELPETPPKGVRRIEREHTYEKRMARRAARDARDGSEGSASFSEDRQPKVDSNRKSVEPEDSWDKTVPLVHLTSEIAEADKQSTTSSTKAAVQQQNATTDETDRNNDKPLAVCSIDTSKKLVVDAWAQQYCSGTYPGAQPQKPDVHDRQAHAFPAPNKAKLPVAVEVNAATISHQNRTAVEDNKRQAQRVSSQYTEQPQRSHGFQPPTTVSREPQQSSSARQSDGGQDVRLSLNAPIAPRSMLTPPRRTGHGRQAFGRSNEGSSHPPIQYPSPTNRPKVMSFLRAHSGEAQGQSVNQPVSRDYTLRSGEPLSGISCTQNMGSHVMEVRWDQGTRQIGTLTANALRATGEPLQRPVSGTFKHVGFSGLSTPIPPVELRHSPFQSQMLDLREHLMSIAKEHEKLAMELRHAAETAAETGASTSDSSLMATLTSPGVGQAPPPWKLGIGPLPENHWRANSLRSEACSNSNSTILKPAREDNMQIQQDVAWRRAEVRQSAAEDGTADKPATLTQEAQSIPLEQTQQIGMSLATVQLRPNWPMVRTQHRAGPKAYNQFKSGKCGYSEVARICFNCWATDTHSVEHCPEHKRSFSEHEKTRQAKKIWNKYWAIRMCWKGFSDILFVPPSFVSQLKDEVSEEIYSKLAEKAGIDKNADKTLTAIDENGAIFKAKYAIASTQQPLSNLPANISTISGATRHQTGPTAKQWKPLAMMRFRKVENFCWNCWCSNRHSARYCFKRFLPSAGRDRLRVEKGLWSDEWAMNLIKNGLMRLLKVPEEYWQNVITIFKILNMNPENYELGPDGYVLTKGMMDKQEEEMPESDGELSKAPLFPIGESTSIDIQHEEEQPTEDIKEQDQSDKAEFCWNCASTHPPDKCEWPFLKRHTPVAASVPSEGQEPALTVTTKTSSEGKLLDLGDDIVVDSGSEGFKSQADSRSANSSELACLDNDKFLRITTLNSRPGAPLCEIGWESDELTGTSNSSSPAHWSPISGESGQTTPNGTTGEGGGPKSPLQKSFESRGAFTLGPQPGNGGNSSKDWIRPNSPVRRTNYNPHRGRWRGIYYSPRDDKKQRVTLMDLPNEILSMICEFRINDIIYDHGYLTPRLIEERIHNQVLLFKYMKPLMRTCYRLKYSIQRILYRSVYFMKLDALRRFLRAIENKDSEVGELVEEVIVEIPQARKDHRLKGYKVPGAHSERMHRRIDKRTGDVRTKSMIPRLLTGCPRLNTLFCKFIGCFDSFGDVGVHKYPRLERLMLDDIDDVDASCRLLWKNVQQFPNLVTLELSHSELNRESNHHDLKISSSIASYRDGWYKTLSTLSLRRAPEISDEWLVIFAARMPKLISIHIEDCRLVTTNGLARFIREMQSDLKELTWIPYLDSLARPDPVEREIKEKDHLCESILIHSRHLVSLRLMATRICSQFFYETEWPKLSEFVVDMMEFRSCFDNEDEQTVARSIKYANMPSLNPYIPVQHHVSLHNSLITFRDSRPPLEDD